MRRSALALLLLGISTAAWAIPLRYAEDRAPAIVNPLFTTSMSEARLNELLFDGLFTDDRELRSIPELVESHETAEDRMSMTLRLRQDVQWHDATPFTADDVLFTIEAMKNPRTASTEAGRVAWIKDVEKVDEHTVRLTFKGEEYSPEDKLHFKILPAHVFDSTAVRRSHTFRNRPIGTGPFMLVGFNDDNSITMQRNSNYFEPVKQDEMVMREVADKNYQAKLIIYQSIEGLVRVLPRDLAALQGDRKVELYPYQTNSWWYLGFNNDDPQLRDPQVREALHHMVDVEALLKPIGTGDIVTGPFVPSSPFYNHDVEAPAHDPQQATALLNEAGYFHDGRQWTKDGKPLTVRLAAPETLETAQDVVINLQAQFRREGITIEPEFLGAAEWKQKVWRDRDFDLILSQWSFDRSEDIYEQFHSSGGRNFVGYSDREVDRLLDEARDAADPQEKKAAMRKAHAEIAEDVPMVFLWTLDSYAAMSVRVKQVVVHPFYFFTWADDWYVY